MKSENERGKNCCSSAKLVSASPPGSHWMSAHAMPLFRIGKLITIRWQRVGCTSRGKKEKRRWDTAVHDSLPCTAASHPPSPSLLVKANTSTATTERPQPCFRWPLARPAYEHHSAAMLRPKEEHARGSVHRHFTQVKLLHAPQGRPGAGCARESQTIRQVYKVTRADTVPR